MKPHRCRRNARRVIRISGTTWATTGEGATRVVNPAPLIERNADLFAWAQRVAETRRQRTGEGRR